LPIATCHGNLDRTKPDIAWILIQTNSAMDAGGYRHAQRTLDRPLGAGRPLKALHAMASREGER